ncbi:ribosome small subunit-dependent GTPase A [Synoicihabitans lomoniglobus]|uniref:Small ribosomal subunit biogenesis GTPase RsgA n=1 Tax=Synoicihabitans lomoniglobus TaxID=2909285 RepID=A0AAE9ZSX8_9BACT|nr:ribosome small subunit-dependent GTPase A [Opitutaceae bacterium LMO-M01]WED64620.1 ribosome small subunit-dependent GTPase A [Opitutaceae bacterium LMO-M01]
MSNLLTDFGWNDQWAAAFAPHAAAGYAPARVVCELRRKFYAVQDETKEWLGECRGGFFHRHAQTSDFPAVGDWVAISHRSDDDRVDIHAVLPRRTKFSRRAAGEEQIEQVVAANIDAVLLVSGLDRNYNPARIQRFLVAARESGAEPVIVLNKCDVHPDPAAVQREVQALVPGVRVLLTSTVRRQGLKPLRELARPGVTLALLGSSGVGKSTLANALSNDDFLPTGEVREKDSKGRHTTTRRELVRAPGGALLIDTPGLRELQLWDVEDGVAEAFADIVELARQCRFTDCRHQNEPGCAVRTALESGALAAERYAHYVKLTQEHNLKPVARKTARTVANQPGWRKKAFEPKRGGRRITSDD